MRRYHIPLGVQTTEGAVARHHRVLLFVLSGFAQVCNEAEPIFIFERKRNQNNTQKCRT